jgi:hypothetical protein
VTAEQFSNLMIEQVAAELDRLRDGDDGERRKVLSMGVRLVERVHVAESVVHHRHADRPEGAERYPA